LDKLHDGLVVGVVLAAMGAPLGDVLSEIDRCGQRGVARVVQLITSLEIGQRAEDETERGRRSVK
jgi:hypothetical protein